MTDEPNKYVCGFAFNAELSHVLMIEKKRPEWQADKWNGIGGHIEVGERPLLAMIREFHEEAGVLTREAQWRLFAKYQGFHAEGGPDALDVEVYFFSAVLDGLEFATARSMTDERISRIALAGPLLGSKLMLPNIRMLLAIALDESGVEPVALRQVY